MSEKTNAEKDSFSAEVLGSVREYRAAARKILSGSADPALRYAASLSRSLCTRAKKTVSSICACGSGEADRADIEAAWKLARDFAENNTEMREAALRRFLNEGGRKYSCITLSVLPEMLFAAIFVNISALVLSGETNGLEARLASCDRLRFIDFTAVFLDFSASNAVFSAEKAGVYRYCDNKTKLRYISELCMMARKEKICEAEKAKTLVASADERGVHVGELLFARKGKLPVIYTVCLICMTLLVSTVYFLLCGARAVIVPILPAAAIACYCMSKELLSICFKHAGRDGLMRIKRERAALEKSVVAVMSILSGGKSDGELFERLENFYLADENPNRFYAVVCNLPDSEKRKAPGDEKIISDAFAHVESLNKKYGARFGIFLRRRRYSRSEGRYIGWERKRGAVLELCRFMRGRKNGITRYIADTEFLRGAKYLITLDSDTNLYAGAADELIGTMMHPLNTPEVKNGIVTKGHAVVQPHIAPTLDSAAASSFATVTSGNGGIDSYAGAAFDIYENVFESGSFCGKGIIDVDIFLEVCSDFFPNERILSHDLLEGNMAGAAIASDITLTDSAPKNAISYYTRLHRWIRGDLQTLPYLLPRVKNAAGEDIKNPMGALSKYKILDNVLCALCPLTSVCAVFYTALAARESLLPTLLFTFSYLIFPVIRAVVSLFLPGGAKMASRRFHGRVMPHICGGIAYAVYKLCAMPYEAYLFADAAVRTAYRFAVSKRNFLNWKTAAAAEAEKNGFLTHVSKMWISYAAGICAILIPLAAMKIIGVLWFCFPFAAFFLSRESSAQRKLSREQERVLRGYAERMWRFFSELVCDDTNNLPPDNYAVSPAERVAYRTSPTNIGLYLASLLGARDLGLIGSGELYLRASKSAQTLSSMLKWRGHLYNWYDIKTLSVIGEPFVSTVDSGNFVCALIAFCEGIKEYACEEPRLLDVLRIYEDMIKDTDMSALYDASSRLFRIGYDVKRGEYSSSFYDTFMSESRMAGYYAAASGQIPREHYFAPSRAAVSMGRYMGIASWSGTVFEYFMPALFLPVIPDSAAEEALSFAYRADRKYAVKRRISGKRYRLFGVSESGYWHFDSEMNYQYKAFGLPALALDPACAGEEVISPYSSFLMLRCGISECLDNLESIKRLGGFGDYGFYEALDFCRSRVGRGYAVVKSFMAHHVGMSFISCVNALRGDIFPRRFMRMPKMRAFAELLYEKIDVAGRDTRIIRRRKERLTQQTETEEYGVNRETQRRSCNILFPNVAMLSNNKLRVVASSSGHISVYDGEKALFLSEYERFSLGGGLRFYLCADGEVYPLMPLCARAPGVNSRFAFESTRERITYASWHAFGGGSVYVRLTVRVSAEKEGVCFECRAKGDFRRAFLFAYGEPVMERKKSFNAHKSFSGLFMESKYESDEEALVFTRRSRVSGEIGDVMGVRAYPAVYGGAFDTVRAQRLPHLYTEKDIAYLARGGFLNTQGAMLAPAFAMRTYYVGRREACGFILVRTCEEEEALYLLSEKNIFSPKKYRELDLARMGVCGAADSAVWVNYLLRAFCFGTVRRRIPHAGCPADIFWKRGISGENNIALLHIGSVDEKEKALLARVLAAFKYMCICGERFDLAVIYGENDAYRATAKHTAEAMCEALGCGNFIGRENGVHLLSESAFEESELAAFISLCDVCIDSEENGLPGAFFDISPENEMKLLRPVHKTPESCAEKPQMAIAESSCGYFMSEGFRVKKPHAGAPFAHIMSNGGFGCVVSENSLGFSYYRNSALMKLTPHTADAVREDCGERLILRVYAADGFEDADMCACASSVDFVQGRAVYFGVFGSVSYTAEVSVAAHLPVKRVRVSVRCPENTEAAVLLNILPCIGEQSEKIGRYVFEYSQSTALVSSVFGKPFCLGVAGPAGVCFFDDEAAFITDGSVFGAGSQMLSSYVRVSGAETVDFYIAAVGAELDREALASLPVGGFEAYDHAPVFGKAEIKTGDALFDASVNYFFPYQTYYSRFTARAGYYQVGGAYGYRDQLQDSLSFIESAPELCRAQIIRCASHQYTQGDVTHWWHEAGGRETGLRSRCSDDLLWLPFAVCEYIRKTGDTELLHVRTPYLVSPPLDEKEQERYETLELGGEDEVYAHMLLAARLVADRGLGEHGLLKIGGGDWNDGMNAVGLRGRGESVWLTEFCAITYLRLARLCGCIGDSENADFFSSYAQKLACGVRNAFDGDRYLRGYYDNGAPLGKKGAAECAVDSLSQSFAVFMDKELYGCVSEESKTAILTAYRELYSAEYGVFRLLSPPFGAGTSKPGYIKGYIPGIRENGGQYTHAAVWACMALIEAGAVDVGIAALKAINPALRSREAGFCERYKIEPYALAGDVYSHPGNMGRGGWSHYTGAAAWYRKAVINCIFGLDVRENGFFIAPHMNPELDGSVLALNIRGTRYRIRFSFCAESGLAEDGRIEETDGQKMRMHLFPFDGKEHTVDYCMKKTP